MHRNFLSTFKLWRKKINCQMAIKKHRKNIISLPLLFSTFTDRLMMMWVLCWMNTFASLPSNDFLIFCERSGEQRGESFQARAKLLHAFLVGIQTRRFLLVLGGRTLRAKLCKCLHNSSQPWALRRLDVKALMDVCEERKWFFHFSANIIWLASQRWKRKNFSMLRRSWIM